MIGVKDILVEPENREAEDWDRLLEGVGRVAGQQR
jgi:hypothetical protein